MEVDENSGLSEDSSLASLTACDVLIRSTSFHMKEKPVDIQTAKAAEGKPAACTQKRIRISVKKLREVAPPCHPECRVLTNDDTVYIPPALSANKPIAHKPSAVASRGITEGALRPRPGRNSEQLPSSERDVQPIHLPPKTYSDEVAMKGPLQQKVDLPTQKAADICISQYDTGQREAVRAVFKQRIQNIPVFKEVKVQLLDNKKDSSKCTQSEVDSAATVAAATAAAIASTAPLLKLQSNLEDKVNSVSEMLTKLQETDKQMQRVAEQQTHLKGLQQLEQSRCHQRVGELEKQMSLFMEQRIQHLENLQQQQMHIQSHLISSALNSGGFQAVSIPPSNVTARHATNAGRLPVVDHAPSRQHDLCSVSPRRAQASSRQCGNRGAARPKSPLKTPTPRRYAPVPVSKDTKMAHKMPKKEKPIREKENMQKSTCKGALGGGRLLEQILNCQETPVSQSTSSHKEPTEEGKLPWHLGRERPSGALRMEPLPAFKSTLQEFHPIERTVKKADDVLQDLGQLKKEMHDILQNAKEWKSDMNDIMKRKDPIVPPSLADLQVSSKQSILQTTKASKAILKDAEKILRAVRKNKKVLEENLDAIIRAKDGNAMYAFIDALTENRDVLEEIRIRRTVDEWIKTISRDIQDEMARKEQATPDGGYWKPSRLKPKPALRNMKASREVKAKPQHPQGIATRRPLPVARASPKLGDHRPWKPSPVVQNEEYLSQLYGRPIYQGRRSTLKKAPYLRFNSPPPKSKPPRPKLIECVRGTKVKSARTQTSPYPHSKGTSSKKLRPFSAPCREVRYLFSPTREAPDALSPLEGHLIPMAIPLDVPTGIKQACPRTLVTLTLWPPAEESPPMGQDCKSKLEKGHKQIDRIFPQPSGVIVGKLPPVTVTTSVPPLSPKPKKPNIAVVEMKSEKPDPPKLTVQVLPSVDIDSVQSDSSNQSLTLLLTKAAIQTTPEDGVQADEELDLPGTACVDVAEASQDEGEDDDVIPEFSEPILEFNRRGEPETPKYNGPPFPPAAPAPQPSADILDEIIEKRETLENKLASWVEQEVMARIINGMYPAQREVVPNVSSSESEDSQAVSDIVEAAGSGGLQLFVSAGVPVNSEMIRTFVNEALAETVAVMLGDREGPKPASATSRLSIVPEKETALPTPVATPPASPPPSPPPPLKEPALVKTPPSSPPVTDIDGDVGARLLTMASGSREAAVSLVGTPVATPEATPPRVATPSPPASEHAPAGGAMESQMPPGAWGDAELPLEEEKPSPVSEEGQRYHPRAVIMSVAKDEEPAVLIVPASVEPLQPPTLPLSEPKAQSPSVHTPSSGQSTEESSLTITETETADRPISEGEVLFSYGQLAAAKAFAEGGLSLPNLTESLTSTLWDAHEMDYDPPSEGQVVRRPHQGYHRDPVLTLFSKLNQVPLASQEEVYQSEDTDNSAGELSEGQRPKLTKAAESILMGHSASTDWPAGRVSERRPRQMASPGQVAGDALRDTNATHGPMSLAELDQPGFLTSQEPQLGDTSQQKQQGTVHVTAVQPRVIRVRTQSEFALQQDVQGDADRTHIEPNVYLTSLLAEEENTPQLSSQPSPAKISVTLPSAEVDDPTQSFSPVRGSSDSSGADTF